MPVLVRNATKDDAGKIAEFAIQLVDQHVAYDPERFARIGTREGMAWFYGGQTEAENAAVFVAEIDNRIIGFAYVTYEEKSYLDLAVSVALLQDIFVDTSARQTGSGRALIEATIEFAKQLGASKVMLHVAVRNTIGHEFFEKCGFRPTMSEMMLKLK
ncbi:MAG: GNAT family N-acetyltransferase [Acidobacteriota bacterium]